MGDRNLKREAMLENCKSSNILWDVLIIGGGATGLGCAVDAASRGLKTILLEQSDFAKATSSRSTKLIHGGLRYLKQGNISLVMEGLKERGLLFQNAPHLTSHLPFVIPHYHFWEVPFYGIGMKVYDLLAGKFGIEKSKRLNAQEMLLRIPTLQSKGLCGGTVYYDGQFDDARLGIALAQTAHDHGATLLNYATVLSFLKNEGKIVGVNVRDEETSQEFPLLAKTVINATGIFSDDIRSKDTPSIHPIMAPSQGIHLVLPRHFMPSDMSLLIPKTKDGRLLFCVPWLHHLVIGTTDTPVSKAELEPKPLEEEIDYLLKYAADYLKSPPQRKDVLSVFTGIRPLVRKGGKKGASLSRNHEILVSDSGLITIAGGKWTTYRKMAEEGIDRAILVGNLEKEPCKTEHLKIHGYSAERAHALDPWMMYGTDAEKIEEIIGLHPFLNNLLHPKLPYKQAQVIWAVREEMARNLEDVLSRRLRALFLNAGASLEIAPFVAQMIAKELGKDKRWEEEQVMSFQKLSNGYLCKANG